MPTPINISIARRFYNQGNQTTRDLLELIFSKDFFCQSITDRVQTYEDACEVLDIKPIKESDLRNLGASRASIAYIKLETIIRALNEGWAPNWDNNNEYKYYPWFKMSCFAFYFSYYGRSFAFAGGGSRLCLKSEELSDYVGKQFLDLWKEFML